MRTRYREPGAEMIAFGELSDSILEGVAGGCPDKDSSDEVDGQSKKKKKKNKDLKTTLIDLGFDPDAVDAFLDSL
jgi:hypothetical protein